MRLAAIPVRAPFPWRELLAYLSHRLIPGVEQVDTERYGRKLGRCTVWVAFDEQVQCLNVTADGKLESDEALQRVAVLFDTTHDSTAVTQHLSQSSLLAPRIRAVPGMRPLGAWSPFELCVRTILGQQVTVAAAGTLMRRLVQRCGDITPPSVLAADLANMGMPGKRVETLRILARAVIEQRVDFRQPWANVDLQLQQLAGFGPWTRAYLAIRLGRDPDAFPETDLGLMRAAGAATPAVLLQQAQQWRPYRAYAATYLWTVRLP